MVLALFFKPAFVDPDVAPYHPPERKRASALHRKVFRISAIVLGAILVMFGTAVGVIFFFMRDTGSPYKVGQALEQFKALQKNRALTSSAMVKGLPAAGVYTYSTKGSESASAPGLPSNGSSYPSTTTATVFAKGCGEEWQWQPLDNRYENFDICPSENGGLVMASRFDETEFYRVTDARLFTCTSKSSWLPAPAESSGAVDGECTNGGNKNSGEMSISYKGHVVGEGTIRVGGQSVPVVHLVETETFTGDTVGSGSVSLWLDRESGLPVKMQRTEVAKSKSVVGWVPSSESFSLLLTSVTPEG